MAKRVFIAEKPSVAKEFAKALKENFKQNDGYLESDNSIVTWCVGHLVNMSYPEEYDANLKKWSFDTIPFIPENVSSCATTSLMSAVEALVPLSFLNVLLVLCAI